MKTRKSYKYSRLLLHVVRLFLKGSLTAQLRAIDISRRLHVTKKNARAAISSALREFAEDGALKRMVTDSRVTDFVYVVQDTEKLRALEALYEARTPKRRSSPVQPMPAIVAVEPAPASIGVADALAQGIAHGQAAGLTKPFDLAIAALVALAGAGYRTVKQPKARQPKA